MRRYPQEVVAGRCYVINKSVEINFSDIVVIFIYIIQQYRMESEAQSKKKFISLMQNLIHHILEDSSHQQTIYQCLNLSQISRLFESLHDSALLLRRTAAHFVCRLLKGNQKIIQSLLLRQNCEVHSSHPSNPEPYIVTGLQHYSLPPQLLLKIMGSLKKLKHKKNILCWSINVKTLGVTYVSCEEEFMLDPNEEIIGIFKEQGTLNKRYSLRGLKEHFGSEQAKKKYEISKYGSIKYK